ncbi:MAG: hypothetical protein LC744_07875 [Chloroflexi bacterium]|nr:hypothetical protein [Chloroflexota bacterium]
MSPSSRRRKGRPYQPLPQRRTNPWAMRLVVLAIGALLVIGSLAFLAAPQ